jgi:hypothetical protein
MGTHAWIECGEFITIDHTAWLEQRTGGLDDDLTADLSVWTVTHTDTGEPMPPDGDPDGRDWPAAARAWCTARGYQVDETGVIDHVETRLDAQVWILRAVTTTAGYRIAIVGINDHPPAVYAEAHHIETADWCDADSVEISCPNGHGWTWRASRELITADGNFTTLTVVFGPNLDAPFKPCPHCAAYRNGYRRQPCGCDGIPWIVCPLCGRRCDVELPTR